MLKMKCFISLIFFSLSLPVYSEYQVEIISNQDPVKKLAGSLQDPKFTDGEIPLLVYHTPDFKQTYAVPVKEWENFKRKDASRSHLFLQMYYANTRAKSNTGKRHIACFTGNASEVVKQFFKKENTLKNIKKLVLSTNSDQSLIGAEFTYSPAQGKKSTHFHFRIPHCYQGGKAPLLTEGIIKTASSSYPEDARMIAQAEPIKKIDETGHENCFESYDILDPADRQMYKRRQLPYFTLRADYDKIKSNENSRPWKGLSIADEASAKKLSDVVLDYFYESMIQNTKKSDDNFIAQKIPAGKNQWCHMPWLNVGEAGREAIHGLTKERELEPSSMYPTAGATPETLGAGWGIGYYNDISCGAIGAIFGTPEKPINAPQFVNIQFPEGTASIKVLFTNAELPELKKSFTMTANVSLNGETNRRLRPVKMIQIDVAIKDSTVIGTKPEADHWFMISYYFDANYNYTSKHKYTGKFESLLKMRPIGVQTGFTPEDSMIFKDAKTNSAGNALYTEANKLLNGPADNPKASCLSCHAAAGTMLRMVPGVKDFTQYTRIKKSTLDFSQQLALAKKNYETRSGQLKAVSFK